MRRFEGTVRVDPGGRLLVNDVEFPLGTALRVMTDDDGGCRVHVSTEFSSGSNLITAAMEFRDRCKRAGIVA